MEDLAVPERPAMPGVAPGTLRHGRPYLITRRERHSVGWQVKRKDGPCFVVARISEMGNEKVVDRFPLTEGGWTLAWAALVNIDLGAARAVAQLLQDRERKARMFETVARGGPVTRFREIGVQILAGDGAVYTLGSHDSVAETDASRLLGPLAGAKAMIPDFIELAFQNDFWPNAAAHAAVVAQDGTIHTIGLDGHKAIRDARKQVAAFNTAASAAATGKAGSAARGDPPAMPSLSRGSLMRSPSLIAGHRRHNIGSQDTRRDGPCFVVTRRSALGNDKVVDRFPPTEGGWAMAWAALVDLDADAAQAAAQNLQRRLAADAALAGSRERQASVYETFARAASVTTFGALGVQIPAGEETVYTIGSADPATKTNSSRLLGRLAGAKAMVPKISASAWDVMAVDGNAAVVFPDGTVHKAWLSNKKAVRAAQEQVGQFNAMAGAAATRSG